jgi:uncharacterized membrane protein YfcA
MTQENLILSASLLPVAIASTWLGVYLVRRTSGPLFFLAVYVLLVLVGAKLMGWMDHFVRHSKPPFQLIGDKMGVREV